MGPPVLFDKSFLQMLSVDESVWFDQYFMANICPLFYVETLADLGKTSLRDNRTPEQEVSIIANKTPELSGGPCAHHQSICINELLGIPIPLTGQIPIAGGRPVKSGDRSGIVYDQFPEAAAFSRWQKEQFKELEHMYAREWREMLANLNLPKIAEGLRKLGIDSKSCKTLEEAKALAESAINGTDRPFDRMRLANEFIKFPEELWPRILKRWSENSYRRLIRYAPYSAHVATVGLFFQIALAANLISSDRPSNQVDIAYLFYLPFCKIFVSGDKLHRRCAPLFLRSDQEFVWAHDLKAELARVNRYFSALPEAERGQGVMKLGRNPVGNESDLLVQLWDRHAPGWRSSNRDEVIISPESNRKLVDEVAALHDAKALSPDEVDFEITDPDSLSLQRMIRRKKGSWFQIPKDLKENNEG